jgi:hypothetical protein
MGGVFLVRGVKKLVIEPPWATVKPSQLSMFVIS